MARLLRRLRLVFPVEFRPAERNETQLGGADFDDVGWAERTRIGEQFAIHIGQVRAIARPQIKLPFARLIEHEGVLAPGDARVAEIEAHPFALVAPNTVLAVAEPAGVAA